MGTKKWPSPNGPRFDTHLLRKIIYLFILLKQKKTKQGVSKLKTEISPTPPQKVSYNIIQYPIQATKQALAPNPQVVGTKFFPSSHETPR
jgi:hypothetical protein